MESYARFKSTNTIPSFYLVFTACYITVYSMKACSVVVWWALKPDWGGACRLSSFALVVRRWFITAMNIFANGGVIAILR
jgi:hypothetical protein